MGSTPLHNASFTGHIKVAIYLLEHDADPNIQNKVSAATCGQAVKVDAVISEWFSLCGG
jgi:hypothetical protein